MSIEVLFLVFLLALCAWKAQAWAAKASESPVVKEKATEIGLGLLSRWLK
jgi:hypothetical protein